MKSQYFVSEEMRCPDGTDYPKEWENDRLAVLFKTMDAIRAKYGAPIMVIKGGGYRTPDFNKKLIEASKARNGGMSNVATNSQHIQGRAADIRPLVWHQHDAEEIRMLGDMIEHMHRTGELPFLGGLGRYPGFVHVDIRRNDGHLTTWTALDHGGER